MAFTLQQTHKDWTRFRGTRWPATEYAEKKWQINMKFQQQNLKWKSAHEEVSLTSGLY
jgi:hypothetical protein